MRVSLVRVVVVVGLLAGLLVGCGGGGEPVFVERSTFLPDSGNNLIFLSSGPGELVVSADSESDDVLVWDVEQWEVTARLSGHSDSLSDVAVSSAGLVGSVSGFDFTARVWDPATGEALHVWDLAQTTEVNLGVVFSGDGSLFAASGFSPVQVWDVESGEVVQELVSDVFVVDIVFSPDGGLLYGAADDRVVVWDVESGEVVEELVLPTGADGVLGLSPDGGLLGTRSSDSEFVLWDTGSWEQVRVLGLPETGDVDEPHSLKRPVFSPDGSMVLSRSRLGFVLWDVESGDVIQQVDALKPVDDAVFSADSDRILLSVALTGFMVWERNDGELAN